MWYSWIYLSLSQFLSLPLSLFFSLYFYIIQHIDSLFSSVSLSFFALSLILALGYLYRLSVCLCPCSKCGMVEPKKNVLATKWTHRQTDRQVEMFVPCTHTRHMSVCMCGIFSVCSSTIDRENVR